jgi:hypothetical protein
MLYTDVHIKKETACSIKNGFVLRLVPIIAKGLEVYDAFVFLRIM